MNPCRLSKLGAENSQRNSWAKPPPTRWLFSKANSSRSMRSMEPPFLRWTTMSQYSRVWRWWVTEMMVSRPNSCDLRCWETDSVKGKMHIPTWKFKQVMKWRFVIFLRVIIKITLNKHSFEMTTGNTSEIWKSVFWTNRFSDRSLLASGWLLRRLEIVCSTCRSVAWRKHRMLGVVGSHIDIWKTKNPGLLHLVWHSLKHIMYSCTKYINSILTIPTVFFLDFVLVYRVWNIECYFNLTPRFRRSTCREIDF